MHKPLIGEKLAVLVANGFCEKDFTTAQKALQPLGVTMRIIGVDNGLVNSWNGEGWGLNFASDSALNAALAVDFSMLLIPGGQRSVDKLKLTAHTRRFINGFMNADKPVVALGEAVDLLAFSESLNDRKVSAIDSLAETVKSAGAELSNEPHMVDRNLLTVPSQDDVGADVIAEFLTSQFSLEEAA